MKYHLYVKIRDEWRIWISGSLQDVLSDFFYHQMHPISEDFTGMRIEWDRPT